MKKKIQYLLFLGCILLLNACGAVTQYKVETYHSIPAAIFSPATNLFIGNSILVRPKNKDHQENIQFNFFSQRLSEYLQSYGLYPTIEQGAETELVAEYTLRSLVEHKSKLIKIHEPCIRIYREPHISFGMSINSDGPGAYFGYHNHPLYDYRIHCPVRYDSITVPYYRISLQMIIFDANNKPIFQRTASTLVKNNETSLHFPHLLQIMFTDFPGAGQGSTTKRVILD